MAARMKKLEASLAEPDDEAHGGASDEDEVDEDERMEYEELMRVHGKPAATRP